MTTKMLLRGSPQALALIVIMVLQISYPSCAKPGVVQVTFSRDGRQANADTCLPLDIKLDPKVALNPTMQAPQCGCQGAPPMPGHGQYFDGPGAVFQATFTPYGGGARQMIGPLTGPHSSAATFLVLIVTFTLCAFVLTEVCTKTRAMKKTFQLLVVIAKQWCGELFDIFVLFPLKGVRWLGHTIFVVPLKSIQGIGLAARSARKLRLQRQLLESEDAEDEKVKGARSSPCRQNSAGQLGGSKAAKKRAADKAALAGASSPVAASSTSVAIPPAREKRPVASECQRETDATPAPQLQPPATSTATAKTATARELKRPAVPATPSVSASPPVVAPLASTPATSSSSAPPRSAPVKRPAAATTTNATQAVAGRADSDASKKSEHLDVVGVVAETVQEIPVAVPSPAGHGRPRVSSDKRAQQEPNAKVVQETSADGAKAEQARKKVVSSEKSCPQDRKPLGESEQVLKETKDRSQALAQTAQKAKPQSRHESQPEPLHAKRKPSELAKSSASPELRQQPQQPLQQQSPQPPRAVLPVVTKPLPKAKQVQQPLPKPATVAGVAEQKLETADETPKETKAKVAVHAKASGPLTTGAPSAPVMSPTSALATPAPNVAPGVAKNGIAAASLSHPPYLPPPPQPPQVPEKRRQSPPPRTTPSAPPPPPKSAVRKGPPPVAAPAELEHATQESSNLVAPLDPPPPAPSSPKDESRRCPPVMPPPPPPPKSPAAVSPAVATTKPDAPPLPQPELVEDLAGSDSVLDDDNELKRRPGRELGLGPPPLGPAPLPPVGASKSVGEESGSAGAATAFNFGAIVATVADEGYDTGGTGSTLDFGESLLKLLKSKDPWSTSVLPPPGDVAFLPAPSGTTEADSHFNSSYSGLGQPADDMDRELEAMVEGLAGSSSIDLLEDAFSKVDAAREALSKVVQAKNEKAVLEGSDAGLRDSAPVFVPGQLWTGSQRSHFVD